MTSLPRAAASMLLAKVGSTRPWSLALNLGRPAASATTGADQEAAPHRHWESLIKARTTSSPDWRKTRHRSTTRPPVGLTSRLDGGRHPRFWRCQAAVLRWCCQAVFSS